MAIYQRTRSVLILAALAVGLWAMFGRPTTMRGVADWYASPSGSGTTCSFASPCSMKTLVSGGMSGEAPGDRFWFRGGTYTTSGVSQQALITINCTAIAPCVFRNYNNEHVIIDANVDLTSGNPNGAIFGQLNAAGTYTTIWGLDFENSSTQNRFSANEANNDPPTTMNEVQLHAKGTKFINNFVRDQNNGVLVSAYDGGAGTPAGQHVVSGNYYQYNGYWGALRSYGHSHYIKNPKTNGEADRSTFDGEVGLRAWNYGTQMYGTDDIAYITYTNSVEAAAGHSASPTTTFPAAGSVNNFYLGAVVQVPGTCYGSKMLIAPIFDNNISWGAGSFTVGSSKGSCDATVTNNYFLHTGNAMSLTTNGTFGAFSLTGNKFYGTPDNSGGPTATFTAAHYPTNTYAASIPTTGADVLKYWTNPYESGRGWVAVWNPDSSANVTIDPSQMGCFTGENVKIYNWQDNNPWDSTPIATQVGCATLSVSSTIASGSITQPSFTSDGSTIFPKPVDLGPQFVVYFMYPDWAGAATPTPTNTLTASATRTPTFTPSRTPSFTPTQTFTPSNTATPSVTPSQSPTPAATSTNTPSVTPTFTATATPTVTPTPSGTFASTSFDTQFCTLAAPMVSQSDTAAFGGRSVYSTVADSSNPIDGVSGTATCTFSVPATGTYRFWVRLNASVSQADSMYVSVDSEAVTATTHIFDMGENLTCPGSLSPDQYDSWWGEGWKWVVMTDRSSNCKGTTTVPGYERADASGGNGGVVLTAGTHTLQFINREVSSGSSALLDYVIVTSDFGFQPSDFALTPTPTPTPSTKPHPHWCNGKLGWHTHAYSAPHVHRPCPWR